MDNGQIPQNLIDRINELANKKKTVGLTPEEKEEQKREEREKRGNQSDYRAKGPAGGYYFFGWNENVCQCRNTCFLSGCL